MLLTADPRFARIAGLAREGFGFLRLFLLSEMQYAAAPDVHRCDLTSLASLFCAQLPLRYGSFAASSLRPAQLEASEESAKALRVELDKKVCLNTNRVFLAGVSTTAEHMREHAPVFSIARS